MRENADQESDGEVETALLDVELFVKYQAPDRAINRLRTALEQFPRSVPLRERLREISTAHKQPDEAARQCLALARMYIERDDFDTAKDRLLEAKQLDPRISIASGLQAIRRAIKRESTRSESAAPTRPAHTLTGDISKISLFDVFQVLENGRLTGTLSIAGDVLSGHVQFNEGRIVGAESGELKGEDAFRDIVEATCGSFDFQRSLKLFPIAIKSNSNTKLILDALRRQDERKR